MDVLIFNAVDLLALIFFAVVSALPLFIAWRIGQAFGARLGLSWIGWVLPSLVVISAASWVIASYTTFERACGSISGPRVLWKPDAPQKGFRIYGNRTSFTSAHFYWNAAIEKGLFDFVDTDYGRRRCAEENNIAPKAGFRISAKCDRYSQEHSNFGVYILPAQRIEYWWAPPIYRAEVQIREDSSNRVAATANDLIFGGGLLGLYMRAIRGDQDFSRLSCGYASKDIGPWRPTLASRLRVQQYQEADLALLQLALLQEPNNPLQPIARTDRAPAER